MAKRIVASETGLHPHYKIRIVIPGALLHAASWNEPRIVTGREVQADWINEGPYGDTIGYIDWSVVVAVTWRWSE